MQWPVLRNGRLRLWYWRARRLLNDHRLLWQRALIVLLVLAASGAISYRFPINLQFLFAILPVMLGGALFLLRKPPLGLILLAVLALIFDLNVPGLGLIGMMVIGLTVLWILKMIAREKQIVLIKSAPIPPLILLVISAIFAFGLGQMNWYPTSPAPLDAQIGGLAIYVVVVAAFLLAAHQLNSERWLKRLIIAFLVLGGLFMIGRLLSPVTTVLLNFFAAGMVGSVFWTWIVAISLSQGLLNRKLSRVARGACLGVTALTFYIAFGQALGWTSGWMPPVIVVGVIIFLARPKLAIPLIAVGLLASPFVMPDLVNNLIYVGDNSYSQVTRLEAWRIVLQIARVNPILGLGPANYSFYTPLFPIFGFYVNFNSHSNYIDLIAQTGIVGLAAFLWFVVETARLGWRLRLRVPKDGFAFAYTYGALGGLAGTVVAAALGDWVIPYVYNVGVNGLRASIFAWLFLGGLVAIEQLYSTHRQGESSD